MDRGRPVQSLQLVLRSEHNQAIYAVTDSEGYARFTNLNSGLFVLTNDHDGDIGDGVNVEVVLNGATNVTVPLKWPNATPVQVQSVSGTLRGPDYYPEQTQPELSLSLLEGVSAHVIETTQTDSRGAFSFAYAAPPGIYFLRLNPSPLRASNGEQIVGMVPVDVSPNAAERVLDVDLGWSSCGLGYSQRTKYPEMKVSKLCGDVVDSAGAAIANAQVMLLANGEKAEVLEQTLTGRGGRFALRKEGEGTYQLLIKSTGFQPFLRVMRVSDAERSEGCQQPIRVQLEIE
ncbi:MAG TPA: carboxypeptidase-like regulatory domain-containing protein [Candidatus Acidoferrales bacterium]|nr:carboxypeptidase-like regulatory domain-containing protein [Candidatus Acidoferrales bacterium]